MGLIAMTSFAAQAQQKSDFETDNRTAIVLTDPQIDFMDEKGKGWGVFGESVIQNKTREHIAQILEVASKKNILVFVSPHYYYRHDHVWHFEGPVEKMMHENGMFERTSPVSGDGFEGSGADWYAPFKTLLAGKNVIVTSPHKVFGPQTNDLVLQMRKRGIDKVIIMGMAGNMCSESHLRDLQEEGFNAAVVFDATASARIPAQQINGDAAALNNFKMLATKVYNTSELLDQWKGLKVFADK